MHSKEGFESILYITEKQLSKITSISVKTLQGMRSKGSGIPYVKIGRLVRYDMKKVNEFMEINKRKSTSNFI